MTLTLPTEFADQKFHSVGTAALVVKITNNDGDAFWFAEKGIDQLVYTSIVKALLYDISPITHGYDYNTLEYQPSHVTCTISNLWQGVKPNSYYRTRASDILVGGSILGLWGQSLQVWWYAGGYADDVSGLLVFDGSIVNIQMDGDDKLSLTCDEIWLSKADVVLPQRKADVATFRGLPVENIGVSLPLVYGLHNESAILKNRGFAVGLQIDNWKYLIADHTINGFYDEPRPYAGDYIGTKSDGVSYGANSTKAIWIYIDELQSWARSYRGVTFDTDDDGRATVLIDPDEVSFDVYLYPSVCKLTSTAEDPDNNTGTSAAYDHDDDTKLSIIAHSATQAEVIFEFRQSGAEEDQVSENSFATFDPPGAAGLEGIDLWCSKPIGVSITSARIDVWDGFAWVQVSANIDTATANMIHYYFPSGGPDVYSFSNTLTNGCFWHFSRGKTGGDGSPFKVRLQFTGSGWTTDSTVAAYIHEARLVISCGLPYRFKSSVISTTFREHLANAGHINPYTELGEYVKWQASAVTSFNTRILGASVMGRMYEYAELHADAPWENGDQITHPAGIIENILVKEFGLDLFNDIDRHSFDDVYNSDTVRSARINLKPGAEITAKQLIDRICFEHTLLLYRARGTPPRLTIVEAVGRPDLAATIRRSELAGLPSVHVTAFNPRNELSFRYRRLPHDNQFFKTEVVEDTLSSGEYGTMKEDMGLETIAHEAELVPIKNRLITTNYFRSRPHYVVDFKTVGNRYAALELGDKIQFEAASMDEVLMLYGQSWSGVNFTIFEATVLRDGHAFRAVTQVPEPASMIGEPECLPNAENIQNQITGYAVVMPETGIIERIEACMIFDDSVIPDTPPNTHTFKAAIYTNAGTPLLVAGTETEERVYVSPGDEDRKIMSLTYTGTKPTLAAGSYYLCFWGYNVNETTAVAGETIGGTGYFQKNATYGVWPASISSPTLHAGERLSIRAFYTPV